MMNGLLQVVVIMIPLLIVGGCTRTPGDAVFGFFAFMLGALSFAGFMYLRLAPTDHTRDTLRAQNSELQADNAALLAANAAFRTVNDEIRTVNDEIRRDIQDLRESRNHDYPG